MRSENWWYGASNQEAPRILDERYSRIVSLPLEGKANQWRLRRNIKRGDALK